MDSPGALAIIKLFAPKLPRVITDAATHTLGLSATSSKWDLKTAVIMSVIRQFLYSPRPSPVSRQQRLSLRDPGIKGPLWISQQILAAPPQSECDELLSHVQSAIAALAAPGEGDVGDRNGAPESQHYTLPTVGAVGVEWTGSRAGASSQAPRPDLDEDGQYERLMASVSSDVTILYIHGGALYLMDPATHRTTCARLAKRTGGRCMSIRYRLAPQNPFPAALVDCLVAYLSLLSPAPGAVHKAVPASKIVFAGDSAGGNLALGLLQLILQMRRANNETTPTVKFHGKDVVVHPPAGLALMSPWTDVTRSLPSIWSNQAWDYLPPPVPDGADTYEPDDLWPTKPPRGDLYCETSMLVHPLVSPLAARDWTGAPPVFMCIGQECLSDEGMVMLRRMVACGVPAEFWQFEAMPHVFTAIFGELRGANLAMDKWASAAARMVCGPASGSSAGTWVAAKTLKETEVDVRNLIPQLTDEHVDQRMADAQAKRSSGEGGERLLARL